MKKIKIFDTTLRDGEQTPGVNLTIEEKVMIAKKLDAMGVDIIEAGFAIASEGDFNAIKAISKEVKNSSVASLARATKKDIDRAWEAVREANHPRIHTFIATSDIHMKYKLKMTKDEVYNKAIEMVAYAKRKCFDIEFSCEDASRSEREFLYKVIEGAIEAGATVINIPDTVGYSYPNEFYSLIKDIKENVSNIHKVDISVHCHNDLGLATANAIAAMEAGADQIECTMNGIGERAGNTSLEEIVMFMNVRSDKMKYINNIDTKSIYPTSTMVSQLTGIRIQPNKAIVGGNAFAHESGIHQHGVMENTSTYEIMTPESIGIETNKMIFGKHSGKHAFTEKLNDMGYTFTDEEVSEIFTRFKHLTDVKKEVFDTDIQYLAQDYIGQKSDDKSMAITTFEIVRHSLNCVKADIVIKNGKKNNFVSGTGDGPVNAIYHSINNFVEKDYKLNHYSIHGITDGADAQGEVRVQVEHDGIIRSGRGIDTDIIRASANAYIDAINNFNI